MRLKTHCWLLLPLLAATVHGQTVTNHYRPVSLAECLRLALLNNRDLQIQRFEPEIARFTLRASYGYYDPVFTADGRRSHATSAGAYDPSDLSGGRTYSAVTHTANTGLDGRLPTGLRYNLSASYANAEGTRAGDPLDSYNLSGDVSIAQPLLKNFWIDSGRMNIRINKKNLKFTELGVDYLVMQIVTQVEQAYYELMYARENVRVQEKLLELKQRFYTETKRKVEVGALTPLDGKLAESQVANVQATLISARNTVSLDENTLKSLLGDNFTSSVTTTFIPTDSLVVVPESFDTQESWRRGLARRPDLVQMRIDVEKMEIEEKFWFNQNFPQLDLVAGYSRSGSSSGRPNTVLPLIPPYFPASFSSAMDQVTHGNNPSDFFGAVFSLPLSRATERNNLKVTRERKKQAWLRVLKQEDVVQRQIDDAIKNARTFLQSVTATREAVAYAQAALDAGEKTLLVGKTTAFVLLQLQSDLATAQSAEIRAKANYNQAVAQLFFAEGSTLERRMMSLQLK